MYRAWFSLRLPARDSRWRTTWPLEASSGAVPVWVAKWCLDGNRKTLRGARGAGADGRRVHLLACMDHTSRTVLAQRQVGGAPEEVPAFQPLLDGLDLA